ncbi:MAG: imidazolonepropionase [Steroidobacteraceae bacterium]
MTGRLLVNATLATMCGPGHDPCAMQRGAAIAWADGVIAWTGAASAVPASYSHWPRLDLQGRLVTPGLIDCHTHIVHAGNRAAEFAARLAGASYEQIACAGGGIMATVGATRNADEAQLLGESMPRIDALLAEGVTTLEIKSGYGLDVETELTMLAAAREVARQRPVRVRASFLGAHALPGEYSGRVGEYIRECCIPALRAAHERGLVDAVDAYCEDIAFTAAELQPLYDVARELGLPVKLHADQRSDVGAAEFAARNHALSADHLEYASRSGIAAMAAAGTVAVLLPGAYYSLRETRKPPIADLRSQGVAIAVATDCNPGTSPLTSLLLAANMACVLFELTPAEALAAITCHAARALGLADTGRLAVGLRADLAIWDASDPAELICRLGGARPVERIFGGES